MADMPVIRSAASSIDGAEIYAPNDVARPGRNDSDWHVGALGWRAGQR
jgi:hypothetical protein